MLIALVEGDHKYLLQKPASADSSLGDALARIIPTEGATYAPSVSRNSSWLEEEHMSPPYTVTVSKQESTNP